jgi:transcriptional regulator with XRE-family HTH domain
MNQQVYNDTLERLGITIAELRKRRGLNQEQLAKAAGMHTGDISNIESGHRNISVKTMLRLATALRGRVKIYFEIDAGVMPQQPEQMN